MRGHPQRSVDEYIRLACSADPEDPVIRPRRATIAPRAAILAGSLLIVLAVLLAARTAWNTHAAAAAEPDATPTVLSATTHPSSTALEAQVVDPLASPAPSVSSQIVVHVAGEVAHPGVVELASGARVIDAIEAAGGVTSKADTDAVNLARTLVDGEQIYLPQPGETLPQTAAQGGIGTSGKSGTLGSSSGNSAALVNLNTADAATLETLPGIGPALAARIIEYRESHGPFAAVEDITDVSGIGSATLEKFREQATV